MAVGNTSDPNDSWWSGADAAFYYAGFGLNWVELIMPANTLAFSLTIDANTSANAWILGVADDGHAIDTEGNNFNLLADWSFDPAPTFNIPLSNGVEKSFGFYAANDSGSCNTLAKVVIDPKYWAMGDFSIHVDDEACSQELPEPSILALFAAGLLGLGLVKRGAARHPGELTPVA